MIAFLRELAVVLARAAAGRIVSLVRRGARPRADADGVIGLTYRDVAHQREQMRRATDAREKGKNDGK